MGRRERLLNTGTLLFAAVASAWILSAPLRHLPDAMRYVADDFYYYLKIASSVAAGHGSTFDGVRLTNGYHPLYMLLWVPVARVGHPLTGVFVLLFALSVAASVTVFVFGRKVIASSGAGAVLSNGFALMLLALPFRMFFQGMEVTLTIPLAVLLIYLWLAVFSRAALSAAQGAALGVVAVAMVLSRLDSALLVFLLLLFTLGTGELRRKLRAPFAGVFALAAGMPAFLYVMSNRIWFRTWLPVSGMAKQMRDTHRPSALALDSLVRGVNGKLLLLIAAAAIALWIVTRRRLQPHSRAVLAAAAFFPVLHCGTLVLLSDWQMWGWYHYSFVPAWLALLAMAAFWWKRLAQTRPGLPMGAAACAVLAAGVAVTATNHWRLDGEMRQIARTATELQPWMNAHPGEYAMGDRAGMVAWLSTQPMFQTEGLVEDRAWLDVLRAQGDLAAALRAKGVRYYITTDWLNGGPAGRARQTPVANTRGRDCVLAIEPAQAGPSAPHLQSVLCDPVAAFLTPPGDAMPKRTLVFDLTR